MVLSPEDKAPPEVVTSTAGRCWGRWAMASRVPFYFVDVFATGPLTGNPLSLVPDAGGLDEAQMRAIARVQSIRDYVRAAASPKTPRLEPLPGRSPPGWSPRAESTMSPRSLSGLADGGRKSVAVEPSRQAP
jgi:hypothetical protein